MWRRYWLYADVASVDVLAATLGVVLRCDNGYDVFLVCADTSRPVVDEGSLVVCGECAKG